MSVALAVCTDVLFLVFLLFSYLQGGDTGAHKHSRILTFKMMLAAALCPSGSRVVVGALGPPRFRTALD